MKRESRKTSETLPPIDITLIDGSNLSFFQSYIPPRFQKEINDQSVIAIGSVLERVPCGALVFRINDSTSELCSVYVHPDFRRQHISTTLFCEAADFLEANELISIESISVEYSDERNGLFEFFNSLRFVQQEQPEEMLEFPMCRLEKCDFLQRDEKISSAELLSFTEISPYQIKQINELLDRTQTNYLGEPVTARNILPDISFICYEKTEPIGCVCLSAGNARNKLTMSIFCTTTESPRVPICLLQRSAKEAMAKYPEYTVQIPLIEESSIHLAEKLLKMVEPDAIKSYASYFEFGTELVEEED